LHTAAHAPPLHAQDELAGRVPLQALHAPVQHTAGEPHDVPSVTFVAEPHTWVPVEHDEVPVWHVLPPGLQATPAVQGTHDPPEQTMLVPHDVPSATLPVALQTEAPVEQDVCPF
jgi:hypothetical protein